jgi:uncharacterized protein
MKYVARPLVLPVIHVDAGAGPDAAAQSLERTLNNAAMAFEAGCDGVFLISMDRRDDVLEGLARVVKQRYPDKLVGINMLQHTVHEAIRTSVEAGLDMTWIDNARVHSEESLSQAKRIAEILAQYPGHQLFGGVAFKYQRDEPNPGLAATRARDLGIIPTTSGPGTGKPADVGMVASMHAALSGGALAIASGITPDNVLEYAPYLSHILVASGVSQNEYDFDFELLCQLMGKLIMASTMAVVDGGLEDRLQQQIAEEEQAVKAAFQNHLDGMGFFAGVAVRAQSEAFKAGLAFAMKKNSDLPNCGNSHLSPTGRLLPRAPLMIGGLVLATAQAPSATPADDGTLDIAGWIPQAALVHVEDGARTVTMTCDQLQEFAQNAVHFAQSKLPADAGGHPGLTRYRLVPGAHREWLSPSKDGVWCQYGHVRDFLARHLAVAALPSPTTDERLLNLLRDIDSGASLSSIRDEAAQILTTIAEQVDPSQIAAGVAKCWQLEVLNIAKCRNIQITAPNGRMVVAYDQGWGPEQMLYSLAAAVLNGRTSLTAMALPADDNLRDATRWRALLGSARIRPIGNAGLANPEPNNYAHLGLELWTTFSAKGNEDGLIRANELGADWLTRYADIALAAQAEGFIPSGAR